MRQHVPQDKWPEVTGAFDDGLEHGMSGDGPDDEESEDTDDEESEYDDETDDEFDEDMSEDEE